MKIITINVEEESNIPQALIEVSKLVEQGYTSGMIGWSSDSWTIDDEN